MITWEKFNTFSNKFYPLNSSQQVPSSQEQNMDYTIYNQNNEAGVRFDVASWSNQTSMGWCKQPKVEPEFSSESMQSPCPSPVDSMTTFLPRSESEINQQYTPSFPASLPLSTDEVESTLSTIVRDPSFAACVANIAQTSLLQDLQNVMVYQEHPKINSRFYHTKTLPKLQSRKRPHLYSEDADRDELYWEKRRKNNMSAKKSRDAKRRREILIKETAIFLEEENRKLRMELSALRDENAKLKENVH